MALGKCKECGNQVAKSAKSCPQCGAQQKRSVGLVGWLFVLIFVLPVAWTIGSGMSGSRTASTVSSTAPKASPTPKPAELWARNEYADQMTDAKKVVLTLKSINASEFKFPYNKVGGSRLDLSFRRTGDELDAYLRIEKGQMQCSRLSCSFSLRVGDGDVQKWTGLPTSTNDSDMMFVRDAERLEKIVKSGQKIRIGIEFFRQGKRAFDFDTAGYPGF